MVRYYDAMKSIEGLKRENERLREDYIKARDELGLKENHFEAKVNNLEFQLNEKDKEDKLILDKILNEHKLNVKELNSNWERRFEELEKRNQGMMNEKENIELELQRVIDSVGIIKQEHQIELKDMQDRIYDQEYHRFEDQVQALNSKIKLLEESRENLSRMNTEEGRSLIDRERKLQDALINAENELAQLKNERVSMMSKVSDMREQEERHKSEIQNKDRLIYKIETELSELHVLLQTTKDNHERDISSLIGEHRRERSNWDSLRDSTYI